MKINILDAHDRLKEVQKQKFDISECCQNLINQRPFGDHPFYIFAHARTDDNGVDKRLIWQPRLTKPKAQTNSMLFKAYPGTDMIKVIWMIPERHLWNNYKKGKLVQNKTIIDSIHYFENNRKKLEMKADDDYTDEKIDAIYKELAFAANEKKMMERVYDV